MVIWTFMALDLHAILSSVQRSLLIKSFPAFVLGYLRIITGIAILWSFIDNAAYYTETVAYFNYTNTYDGFDWIKPVGPELMPWLVGATFVVYVLFISGVLYRPVSILTALLTWYFFLVEKGHYNNHYYLYALLATLFVFVDGSRLSFGDLFRQKKPERLPMWQLTIFRLQFALVYFFGGIAKLDVDWLQGFPMSFWLYDFALFELPEGSWLQALFMAPETGLIYSYAGLLFDLLIPILLLSSRLRKWAVLPLVFFHISNHFFFDIGSFPFAMLMATPIFFDGEALASKFKRFMPKRDGTVVLETPTTSTLKKRAATSLFVLWIGFQLLFPLRQFMFDSNPSWTGQGQWFSWRMMLVSTVEACSIRIIVPEDGVDFYVTLDSYMTYHQFRKAIRTPMIMLKFIQYLKAQLKENGVLEKSIIKLEMYKSINYRPPTLFNDTTLNYANVEYNPFVKQQWILPVERKTDEVWFREHYLLEWQNFIQSRADSLSSRPISY